MKKQFIEITTLTPQGWVRKVLSLDSNTNWIKEIEQQSREHLINHFQTPEFLLIGMKEALELSQEIHIATELNKQMIREEIPTTIATSCGLLTLVVLQESRYPQVIPSVQDGLKYYLRIYHE